MPKDSPKVEASTLVIAVLNQFDEKEQYAIITEVLMQCFHPSEIMPLASRSIPDDEDFLSLALSEIIERNLFDRLTAELKD